MLSQVGRQASDGFFKKVLKLSIGGAVVFWATTVIISLLPIAAEYRASFTARSWNVQTVWVDSLLAGLVIGSCVSFFLLRFIEKNPARNPIQKAALLGFTALAIAVTLVDLPQSFLLIKSGDALYYFIIGILLNTPRFLFLGLTIGCLYKRLYGQA